MHQRNGRNRRSPPSLQKPLIRRHPLVDALWVGQASGRSKALGAQQSWCSGLAPSNNSTSSNTTTPPELTPPLLLSPLLRPSNSCQSARRPLCCSFFTCGVSPHPTAQAKGLPLLRPLPLFRSVIHPNHSYFVPKIARSAHSRSVIHTTFPFRSVKPASNRASPCITLSPVT